MKPVHVTQPFLPPLSEFTELLEGVWENKILTHNGPLVQRFEKELERRLGVNRFVAVTNCTIALQMAIRALNLKGEIIISAFTWIATVSAVKWEGCTPVCCDINAETFNIDTTKIEELITPNTVAIMPVHVFGNPCDVDTIQQIADKHGLKVIYDAAHAIGTTWHGKSVLGHGDISCTSMHATKLLNSAEGGGCITKHSALASKLERIRFFGHDENKNIVEDGFNGKMTEVHAALGLVNLNYFDDVLKDRVQKAAVYKELLKDNPRLTFQQKQAGGDSNDSYFPVVFESEELLLNVLSALAKEDIYPRRYFHPSVNQFTEVIDYKPVPVSENISSRILCLPLFYQLQEKDQNSICKIINKITEKVN